VANQLHHHAHQQNGTTGAHTVQAAAVMANNNASSNIVSSNSAGPQFQHQQSQEVMTVSIDNRCTKMAVVTIGAFIAFNLLAG
jgi:hypothetical protein